MIHHGTLQDTIDSEPPDNRAAIRAFRGDENGLLVRGQEWMGIAIERTTPAIRCKLDHTRSRGSHGKDLRVPRIQFRREVDPIADRREHWMLLSSICRGQSCLGSARVMPYVIPEYARRGIPGGDEIEISGKRLTPNEQNSEDPQYSESERSHFGPHLSSRTS